MATDLRGHTVPAAGEGIDFNAINKLSASINATKTVANMVEADQYLADLTAASLPTNGATIFNAADNKSYIHYGDAWQRFRTSADDTAPALIPLSPGFTGTARWWRTGPDVTIQVRLLTKTVGGVGNAFTSPAGGAGFEINPPFQRTDGNLGIAWLNETGDLRATWVGGVGYSGIFTYRPAT